MPAEIVSSIARLIGIVSICSGMLLGACIDIHKSADFERHRASQIVEPYDRNDVMYFDVTFSAQFPENDPAAEATRMEWLEDWLEQRKICPEGYEIVTRRPFESLEYNPAHHDMRYEFTCRAQPID